MAKLARAASAGTVSILLLVTAGCGTAGTIAGSSEPVAIDPHPTTMPSPPPSTQLASPWPTTDPSNQPTPTDATPAPPADATPAPPADEPVIPSAAELRAARSQPVEDPYYPDTSNPEVDALHYFLDLSWDGSRLTGEATVTFRAAAATEAVRLDLSRSLTVNAVELDGTPVDYQQAGDGLELLTEPLEGATTYTLTIDYAGAPTSTPAPSYRPDLAEGLGWNVDSDGSVYTFQEPYGAFTWYPVNDHPSDKALYDAVITTEGDDVAVFNGELVSTEPADNGTTNSWHVNEPVASYLTTIAIGPYTEHTSTTPSGMRISYWLMPRDEHLLTGLQDSGSRAFEWLEEHAGPYPFSTLGVVVVGGRSAMETQTMLTMSRGAVARPDAVLQHEMSHQWYGDSVTPVDWQGVWLSEGWAMYMQQEFETDTGLPPFAGGLEAWRPFDLASRKVSGPPGDYNPESFGDLNIYLGPAMMLDEIRQRVGDATFAELAKAWAADHENENVDRQTFESWLHDETGEDFGPLMHKWLDSAKTPR